MNTPPEERLRSAEVTVRQLAIIDLADQPEVPLAPVLAAVADDDATVRRLAVELLEDLGDPRAVPALIDALDDPDAEVRLAAASALREMRDEAAVPALIA